MLSKCLLSTILVSINASDFDKNKCDLSNYFISFDDEESSKKIEQPNNQSPQLSEPVTPISSLSQIIKHRLQENRISASSSNYGIE